jgi:uncharacterized phage-associated protein
MLVTKELQKLDSIFLSEYIAQKVGSMSHLKLQKLLYYVEAYHLAYFDRSIVDDEFEAWVHGPVSRRLYVTLKGYSILYDEVEYTQGKDKFTPAEIIHEMVSEDQLEIINDVLESLGGHTATELENFTHSEIPWIEARKGLSEGDKSNRIISKEVMKQYYKKELYGEDSED